MNAIKKGLMKMIIWYKIKSTNDRYEGHLIFEVFRLSNRVNDDLDTDLVTEAHNRS